MADTKERTVSYRRADWLNIEPASINLGSCVKQAVTRLKSVDERTISRPGGRLMRLASAKGQKEGHLLHITVETPGEFASIIPTADKVIEEVEVGTAAPPDGAEFMDADAFLFIKGNDVCMCATNLHDGGIRDFLIAFFEKAKIRKDSSLFDLIKVASIPKLKLIQNKGVEEIELRASMYWASAHYLKRKAQPQGLLGGIARHVRAILGNEHDANPDALNVTLTLKTDRRRKGLTLGEKRLKEIGLEVLRNQQKGDEFTIITKDGQRIGPDELYVRTTAEMESLGKSVQRDEAWKEVVKFYEFLEGAGALEE